jgi:hypothetical protein
VFNQRVLGKRFANSKQRSTINKNALTFLVICSTFCIHTQVVMSLFDEYSDEKWWVRAGVRVARKFARFDKKWQLAIMLFTTATACWSVYSLFVCVAAWSGSGAAVIDSSVLKTNALYGQFADHVDAYRWYRDKDPIVAQHVLDARARVNRSELLTLVSSSDTETQVSRTVPCLDLFATDVDKKTLLDRMMYESMQFLQHNPAQLCTCGDMLSHPLRYLAAYSPTKRDAFSGTEDESEHTNATAAATSADDSKNFFHAFNPEDELEAAYDSLDTAALTTNNIELAAVVENQDTRYNERRGEFVILRRTSIRLQLMDLHCHKQVVRMRNTLAYCTQQCLDLMRGIDVRERARMQYARGVQLNAEKFKEINRQRRHSEL